MPGTVVLGLQWGDEGKGKIVDCLALNATAVVRFQGGHNAGHTIIVNGKKVILHLVPSGILQEGSECLIGSGVVVSPTHLREEIAMIEGQKIDVRARLRISSECPLLFDCHRRIDLAREIARGGAAIGTTGRGIGPAYEDKVARRALRLSDLLDEKTFAEQLEALFAHHNFEIEHRYHGEVVDFHDELNNILGWRDELLAMVGNVSARLMRLREQNVDILFEGAQGTMLDNDHGTYPYVTSSNTTIGAAVVGAGVPPSHFDRVLGIIKAYTTRVGNGPFPTELDDKTSAHLVKQGNEFGATTQRERRCGWFDVVAVRRAIAINGVDSLCLTKLDVLDGLNTLQLCVGYHGHESDACVYSARTCETYVPEYMEMPGWPGASVAGITDYSKLPQAARDYVERMESLLDVPINMISTSPDRSGNILRNH